MDLGEVASLWFVRPEIACRIAVILKTNIDVPVAWSARHPARSSARGTIIYYRKADVARVREYIRSDRVPYRLLLGDGEPTWSRWRPIEHRWEITDFWKLLEWLQIQ